ncbi:MAG TPA: hypothetical protein VGR47_03760 [Terracidiphilus sp.]|nr:hypothetical protein [Terracidiphilus sp.]
MLKRVLLIAAVLVTVAIVLDDPEAIFEALFVAWNESHATPGQGVAKRE